MSNEDLLRSLLDDWPERAHPSLKSSALNLLFESLKQQLVNDTKITDKVVDYDLVDRLHKKVGLSSKSVAELRVEVRGNLERLPIIALASVDIDKRYSSIERRLPMFLQVSILFALIGSLDHPSNRQSVNEAAGNIRRLIESHRAKVLKGPQNGNLFDVLEFFSTSFSDNGIGISNKYVILVKKGLSEFYKRKEFQKVTVHLRRKGSKYPVPHVQTTLLPFPTIEIDNEDLPGNVVVLVDPKLTAPIKAAQRAIFRNNIVSARELFCLQLSPIYFSSSERSGLLRWIKASTDSLVKASALVSILTTLKPYEIMGVHISPNSAETSLLLESTSDQIYGVIDISLGVYWRRELNIESKYRPSNQDALWLHQHASWLALPIPDVFLISFRNQFSCESSGTIENILALSNVEAFEQILTKACHEIRVESGANRPITRRALRHFLYAELTTDHGQNLSSLVFANNEFGLSTWHFYMAYDAHILRRCFEVTVVEKLQLALSKKTLTQLQSGYVGSELAVSIVAFAQRLNLKLFELNKLLKNLSNISDLSELRNLYNFLTAYTLTMFFAATCHRRHNSAFVEHSCWNNDYTQVLVADKIHFGESASRLISVPALLTNQISNTIAWISQIAKKVAYIDPKFSEKLFFSLQIRGGIPFLGEWTESNTVQTASTSQVKILMGDDWCLPQNALRQFMYQTLLSQSATSPFLDHIMGHVSSSLHGFQNTSVQSLESEELAFQSELIQEALVKMGFQNLVRTKTDIRGTKKGEMIWPKTIERKLKNKTKANIAKANNELDDAIQEAIKSDVSLYEVLAQKLESDPDLYELVIRLLDDRLSDMDSNNLPLDDGVLEKLFASKYHAPPRVEKVLPYGINVSSRLLEQLIEAFSDTVKVVLSPSQEVTGYSLEALLLISLIIDGDDYFLDVYSNLVSEIKLKNVIYKNGYLLIANDEHSSLFGGLSSILIMLTLAKQQNSTIAIRFKSVEQVLKQAPELQSLNAKIESLLGTKKWNFSNLYQAVRDSPRKNENGILYGLRQKTVKARPLTSHSMVRLIAPKCYFERQSLQPIQFKIPEETPRTQWPKHSYNAVANRKFLRGFYSALNVEKKRSQTLVITYWKSIINELSTDNNDDLVSKSRHLPEVWVLLLSWLLSASARKGRRKNGLAASTIRTYLSKFGSILLDVIGDYSLINMDSDDLIQIYQDVIDSGDVYSRKQRLVPLQDFHRHCMRHFGLCEVDWHDLDIDLSEQVVATNIITPWEYQDALRLLQRDECQSLDDRNICAVILILSYRLALRRQEIKRLRTIDWDINDKLCYVRTNRFGKTKSMNGNRRIPFDLLLNKGELLLIQNLYANALKKGEDVPLFFDALFSSRICHMDKYFSRVIEALRLVTGNPDIRLHDGRHSMVTFVGTALVIDDRQDDPIARAVKEWIPEDSVAFFKKRFKQRVLSAPSTDHALFPALAMMVGHGSATTTITNYFHLTHYWRWVVNEKNLRSDKSFDNIILLYSTLSKTELASKKNRTGLSAAYVISSYLAERIHHNHFFTETKERKKLKLKLSELNPDQIHPQLIKVWQVDAALRYLEFTSRFVSNESADSASNDEITYQLQRSDLTESFVSRVEDSYKIIIRNVTIYRAYSIDSRDLAIQYPTAYLAKAAQGYMSDVDFQEILTFLLKFRMNQFHRFETLLGLWGDAWNSSSRSLNVVLSDINLWNDLATELKINFEFGCKETTQIKKRIKVSCREITSINGGGGLKISIPKFSHAIFLLLVLSGIK